MKTFLAALFLFSTVLQAEVLTVDDMNRLTDEVYEVYAPILTEKGLTLKFNRKWNSSEANAYANRDGNVASIDIHGGLGNVKYMSDDHFVLLLCHELGHHLAGAPFLTGRNYQLSVEPQSDYFAGKECMRKVLKNDRPEANVPQKIKDQCQASWSYSADYILCTRTALAAELFGKRDWLLTHYDVEPEGWNLKPISLLTPFGERTDFGYSFGAYPTPQCRVDTFFQGALCNKNECEKGTGARPFCWTSVIK